MEKINCKELNFKSMTDTLEQCKKNVTINAYVRRARAESHIVSDNVNEGFGSTPNANQQIIVSSRKTFEAAKPYALRDKQKVAVLNFANAHTPGGAPFSSGAQEEVLCRCSTLYPCLTQFEADFYQKHINDYKAGKIDWKGTDDIIYSPDVYVFKDDTNDEAPIDHPFFVDVITCAAPELYDNEYDETDLQQVFDNRAAKIISVAEQNGVDVLILGAFGCGAFCNPPRIVAEAFKKALKNTSFDVVEFAICTRRDSSCLNFDVFRDVFENN